jgi:hypothetical protein
MLCDFPIAVVKFMTVVGSSHVHISGSVIVGSCPIKVEKSSLLGVYLIVEDFNEFM